MQARSESKKRIIFGGRYSVVRELSKGRVFLCSDAENAAHLVALKVCPISEISTESFNLRREFIIHSQLDSNLVVPLHEPFESKEHFGFSMQFIGGGDLADKIESGARFSDEEIARILHAISGALAEVHAKALIHADIKPENILISSENQYLLTDFGLARDTRQGSVKDSETKGTMRYLPPEYLMEGTLTPSSDIYALGLVGYELMMRQVPFENENILKMLQQRVSIPVRDLRKLNPKAHGELCDVITKCLSLSPGERYQDGGAMKEHLDKILPHFSRSNTTSIFPFLQKGSIRRRQQTQVHSWKSAEVGS